MDNKNILFLSTDAHLCKFLQTTGRNWRDTLYIECGNCPRAISSRCRDMLCAFDTANTPVIVPVQDVERLLHITVDKSECLAVVPRNVFSELHKAWIDSHIRDPRACPFMDLHVDWGPIDHNASPIFNYKSCNL